MGQAPTPQQMSRMCKLSVYHLSETHLCLLELAEGFLYIISFFAPIIIGLEITFYLNPYAGIIRIRFIGLAFELLSFNTPLS
jgi:hypothetical protein